MAKGNWELNKIDGNIESSYSSENNHQSDPPQNNHFENENNWGVDFHLFSALMENLPDVIYFKDLDSRFIKINNGFLKKVGAVFR